MQLASRSVDRQARLDRLMYRSYIGLDVDEQIVRIVAQYKGSGMRGFRNLQSRYSAAQRFIDLHLDKGVKAKAKEQNEEEGRFYSHRWSRLRDYFFLFPEYSHATRSLQTSGKAPRERNALV